MAFGSRGVFSSGSIRGMSWRELHGLRRRTGSFTPRRPRIVRTRWRAAVSVALACAALAACGGPDYEALCKKIGNASGEDVRDCVEAGKEAKALCEDAGLETVRAEGDTDAQREASDCDEWVVALFESNEEPGGEAE